MKHAITRRDFMNGVAIGTAASLLAPAGLAAQIAPGKSSVYYPPTRTGLRGSHPGSYEVAHALAWSGQKPARHRKLGEHGFNHETDIKAITVNRWPHGYAYEYMSLDDPEWAEGQAPHEIGRARFGRISIANSDAEGRAYLDAAVDAGWRAVGEQTA